MILVLPPKGLNLSGIDSHVFRPIMTALVSPGEGGVEVTFLKCFISGARRHGFRFYLISRAYGDKRVLGESSCVLVLHA